MTLKLCPMVRCGGDLVPHCSAIKTNPNYSTACDLVVCVRCSTVGSLDGRWWPTTYARITATVEALRDDTQKGKS